MNPLLTPFPKSPSVQVIAIVGDDAGAGVEAARRAAAPRARIVAAKLDLLVTVGTAAAAALALLGILSARDHLRLAAARREGRREERAWQARRHAA